VSNEFSETEIPETADTQPENNSLEIGPLSDTGRLSIQGVPPDDDAAIDSDHQPDDPENPEPDVPDSPDEEWITVHAGNEIEKEPSPEGEPRSVRIDEESESQEGYEPSVEGKEGDHRGKEGLEPPEGWTPGGPERGF